MHTFAHLANDTGTGLKHPATCIASALKRFLDELVESKYIRSLALGIGSLHKPSHLYGRVAASLGCR